MQPTVLFLLPTSTYRAEDLLRAATAQGIAPIVGCERPQALEGQTSDTTVTVTLDDLEQATREILELHARRPLRAVIGLDEETLLVAANASSTLGLPHAAPCAVARLVNKRALRQLQQQTGLPHPSFRVATADDDVAKLAATQEYPCVLKPTFLSASRGVIRADNEAQFNTALTRVGALLRRPDIAARGGTEARAILIEEFLPGPEVAFEGIVDHGRLRTLAIFDKPDPLDGPFFEETIYVTPSRLAVRAQQQIEAAVRGVLEAAGLRHGPVHAELRLGARMGPTVIEAAPRSIGGLCGRTLRFATGQSIEEIILAQAVGRELPTDLAASGGGAAGVMMLPIPAAGTLRGVDGQGPARAVPGIDDLVISIRNDQVLEPLPEGNRYLGFLFARGPTGAAVEHALRTAHAELDVRIEASATDRPMAEPYLAEL